MVTAHVSSFHLLLISIHHVKHGNSGVARLFLVYGEVETMSGAAYSAVGLPMLVQFHDLVTAFISAVSLVDDPSSIGDFERVRNGDLILGTHVKYATGV